VGKLHQKLAATQDLKGLQGNHALVVVQNLDKKNPTTSHIAPKKHKY